MIVYKEYNRARAVAYAKRWALSRNPLFVNFAGRGGDCTSFVSQCLYAGTCQMNFTPDFGWYYIDQNNRAPAWSSVEYFHDFLVGDPAFASQNGGVGPYATEVGQEAVEVGDVSQYANINGDWYHTVIISGFDGDEILVCAQSDNALDRPLSTYTAAVEKRFLHIEGVRIEINDDVCFETLLEGGMSEQPGESPMPDAGTDAQS